MAFFINQGSDNRLESAIASYDISAAKAKGCGMDGCECEANWQKFKKDPSYNHYIKAHRVKVGKMEAVSPPGWGGTVKHMIKDHPGISNPHALAWHMYEKGDKSHKKAPKGTGAKHVSERVAKKREKALKAGGPGSGRHPMAKVAVNNDYRRDEKFGDKENKKYREKMGFGSLYLRLKQNAWSHYDSKGNNTQGKGAASLKEHLSKQKTMSAGGPGSGRHAGEGASTKTEHEAAAKLHAELAAKFLKSTQTGAQQVAMDHFSAETAHNNAARLQTDRPTRWAQQASGTANAAQEAFEKGQGSHLLHAGKKRKKVKANMPTTTTKLPNDMLEES